MIVGVGIDLVEVARIRAAIERPNTGAKLTRRVFTSGEIAYCERRRNRFESYAARFAAKEAMIKALGQACGWCEMEVVREDGAPSMVLSGRAAERAAGLAIRRIHLSMTHTAVLAAAYVIAES